MDEMLTAYYQSPTGRIEIKGNDLGIASVSFINDDAPLTDEAEHAILNECKEQLHEYFGGQRKTFSVRLNPKGTEFQDRVWNTLLTIPFGKTASYLNVAEKVADRNATRAVGNANGCNPIAIIIPCHRVIGKNGNLTGYAGELWRKQWLLKHEAEVAYGRQGILF